MTVVDGSAGGRQLQGGFAIQLQVGEGETPYCYMDTLVVLP